MTVIENTPHIAHLVYSFRVGGLLRPGVGVVNLLVRRGMPLLVPRYRGAR